MRNLLAAAAFIGLGAMTPGLIVSVMAEPVMEKLDIVTASGRHPFDIELVRSRPDMEKGLMFRRFLPENRGMLFDFREPQMISMWMKNTYLPLDMVFIGKDGKVTHVAANAEPMSETIISSDVPAEAVLEVNAGVAAKLGIHDGDAVHASIFPK